MSELSIISDVVNTGSNAITAVIAYFIWKIDRRLLLVELWMKSHIPNPEDNE